jgi:hypothetical protein
MFLPLYFNKDKNTMVKQGQTYNGKNKDRHTMIKQGQKDNGKTWTKIQW